MQLVICYLYCSVMIYGSYTILIHLCEVDGKLPFSSASTVLVTEISKVIIHRLCKCCVIFAHFSMNLAAFCVKPRPSTKIWVNGKVLEEMDWFKFTQTVETNDGSKDHTGTITLNHDMLAVPWKKTMPSVFLQRLNSIPFVLSILLFGFESWELTADLERRIQAFQNKCYIRTYGCLSYHTDNIE